MRLLTAAALLLTFHAAAQELPSPVTSGDFFDISGTVLDSVSAKPVALASVSLTSTDGRGGTRTTRANPAGEFAFARVPIGVYSLASNKPGYAQGVDSFKKVILVGGAQPSHFELRLNPEAVISGVLRGDAEEPIADATVVVVRQSIVNGRKRLDARETAKTNATGQFRLAGLGPGPCYVAAMPSATPGQRQKGLGYAPTFYPNATDLAGAQSLSLQPGVVQQADIDAALQPAFTVSGTVASAANSLNLGLIATTEATTAIQPATKIRFDAKTGAFSMSGVPAGNYLLEASLGDNDTVNASAFQPFTVSDHDVTNLNFSLTRGPSLRGSVHVDGASPQVVTLVGVQSLFDGYGSPVDRAGNFTIGNGARPGRYRLIITAAPGWFLTGATQGGRDVLREDVLVGPDGASPPVSVTVGKSGAAIEATVTWPDDGPRKAVVVTVLEQSNGEMRLVADARVVPPNPPAVTRPALLGGLPAGNYVAYAWPEPVSVEYAVLEALRPYEAFAQTVQVGESEQARVALKVAQIQ